MSIVKEKYNANRINLLYQMLLNDKEQGQPREYDIKVDDLKIVQRTNDPERFHMHEEFVQPETKNITINIYDGNSRRCTKYQLWFNEIENNTSPTLAGIENSISEKISSERKQWEHEQLKKERETLQQQLTEAEEYIEQLESRLEEEKDKKIKLKDNIGDIASQALEGMLRRNLHWFSGVPVLEGLAGTIQEDNKRLALQHMNHVTSPHDETPISFTRKAENKNEILEEIFYSPCLKNLTHLLQKNFSDHEQQSILNIGELFAQNKENIRIVQNLLHAALSENATEQIEAMNATIDTNETGNEDFSELTV